MNTLLTLLLRRSLRPERRAPEPPRPRSATQTLRLSYGEEVSSALFLVLRRMRWALIVLILIYAVSVLGLTFVPGVDAQGQPWRMNIFHAFYFMSYTATTIGFGEIPNAFSDAQRLWVTFCIYLSVIGWAYAIGSLLALLQDRGFRQALAIQSFARQVRRIREPYYVIVGYGQTGRLLGHALDALGKRFVVLDAAEARVDELQLANFRADVPALAADATNPANLQLAGLATRHCAGVFVLTDDDQANLAVAISVRLLAPKLPVLSRCLSPAINERLAAFDTQFVIDPFDRFGDFLALAIRAPATLRLVEWITGAPGSELDPRRAPPRGRWVVCGYGRFGQAVVRDLEGENIDLVIISEEQQDPSDPRIIGADGTETTVLERAGIAAAVGLIAGTGNDTTNLSIVAAARRLNPRLYIVARQNRQVNAPLYEAIRPDFTALVSEVVAHECLARLTTPLLMRFLELALARGDAFAATLIARIEARCGPRVPFIWAVYLNARGAPAIADWFARPNAALALGELMRDPAARERPLAAIALMVVRGGEIIPCPEDGFALAPGDEILVAGRSRARRHLLETLQRPATREYVLIGHDVPASWVWQKFVHAGRRP